MQTCPHCTVALAHRDTRYGVRSHCPMCERWSWRGAPLADAATHHARIEAHQIFDPLWKSGNYGRNDAYRELARRLDISLGKCHIAQMSVEQCEQVISIAHAMRREHTGYRPRNEAPRSTL